MTLLLTEINWRDNLLNSFIVFAADRRISKPNGDHDAERKKIFEVQYLHAGIGYFGLAYVPKKGSAEPEPMSDWLLRFIRINSMLSNMELFANKLANNLNSNIPQEWRRNYISGFHLAGYNFDGIPEFWFIRNVEDDRITRTGSYEAREDFINAHAPALGYDGKNPNSIKPYFGQIYRNGDIRAHFAAWENIDKGFLNLLKEPEFKKLATVSDHESWVKFKMEIIAYFYKKYCNVSLIARPIDTFSIVPTKNRTNSIAATTNNNTGMLQKTALLTTNTVPISASSRQIKES